MKRRHVLLVHGIFDTGRVFRRMARALAADGWIAQAIDLKPNNGTAPLDVLAEQVAGYVQTHMPQDDHFVLVGYSMGGLVSRYYLQRLGGLARVSQFISIATPHHGSIWAYVAPMPGCKAMRPDSAFLADLNHDADRLRAARHVSIWTPYDLVLLPHSSAIIDHGENIRVPALAHPLIVSDRRCIDAVRQICQSADSAD